ncbi:MAG TPA: polysaccharide deacetylase family protein [Phycisphaerae bacterium]|nr:polysaccharide deacetylase family protein [Phycisphaerae bacterium]HNU46797.1 polysaccharide deacetylase family protein [Phycisphaerae bacterium]
MVRGVFLILLLCLGAGLLAANLIGCDLLAALTAGPADGDDVAPDGEGTPDTTDGDTHPGDTDDGAVDGGPAGPFYVNLQVDAETEDTEGIARMLAELQARQLPATVFVTAEYANEHARDVQQWYRNGFEIALHGFYTGEQLATMTYDEQLDLLTRAQQALEGCRPCGTYKPIIGFRPQYFSQNENTYRVLDQLGMTYNCGFKHGQLFMDGHESDTAPYLVEGHNFHAVPFTTVTHDDEGIYLCDIAVANVQQMTGAQWSGVLLTAMQQAYAQGDPFVVLFHGWYTGNTEEYDYWDAFVGLLDALTQYEPQYVTTEQLVAAYSEATP